MRSIGTSTTKSDSGAVPFGPAVESVFAGLCRLALSRIAGLPIAVVLPSGTEVAVHEGGVRYRILLRSHRAVLRFATLTATSLGDLYRDGELHVEGDLVELLAEVNRRAGTASPVFGTLRRIQAVRRAIGRERAVRNAKHHYELGNDFFAAWLDPEMTYTCALFAHAGATLAEAQSAKMKRICAKLRLSAGERVIEAGCGWGALALHMARNHGARVRAFNVSAEQVDWARHRARTEGLEGLVEFVFADYREISGEADAFVSVGMLEHVGPRHYPELGATISRTIGDRGRALLHTIGRVQPVATDRWIDRRIFPDGYSPSVGELSQVFEPNDLAVLHLENLRSDYAMTLAHWLRNFDRAAEGALAAYDPRLLRSWRLYLAASQAAFLTGWAQLYQLVLTSRRNTAFPAPDRT